RSTASSLFSFYGSRDHRDLHSFPTRRSSDLGSRIRRGRTSGSVPAPACSVRAFRPRQVSPGDPTRSRRGPPRHCVLGARNRGARSEEHTSELQSRENLVCRLLLEKKNATPNE